MSVLGVKDEWCIGNLDEFIDVFGMREYMKEKHGFDVKTEDYIENMPFGCDQDGIEEMLDSEKFKGRDFFIVFNEDNTGSFMIYEVE